MKIAIAGANGRMGHILIEAVLKADDAILTGALDVANASGLGNDAGLFLGEKTGVSVESDMDKAFGNAEYVIDFTRPAGTLEHLAYCVEKRIKMIIGTTGFDDNGKKVIEEASKIIPIVFAPNMSVGVNVTMKLLEIAARNFAEGYDIEVIEAHHRHKVDAPSGTALKMGEVIANAIGRDLAECAVYSREGITGERDPSTIGFSTIRGEILSAIIPFYSPEQENVLKSPINRQVAPPMHKAVCVPHVFWLTRQTDSSTCRTSFI